MEGLGTQIWVATHYLRTSGFHHHSCLLSIIIPPVTDVHVMLKRTEWEESLVEKKRRQGKIERHL